MRRNVRPEAVRFACPRPDTLPPPADHEGAGPACRGGSPRTARPGQRCGIVATCPNRRVDGSPTTGGEKVSARPRSLRATDCCHERYGHRGLARLRCTAHGAGTRGHHRPAECGLVHDGHRHQGLSGVDRCGGDRRAYRTAAAVCVLGPVPPSTCRPGCRGRLSGDVQHRQQGGRRACGLVCAGCALRGDRGRASGAGRADGERRAVETSRVGVQSARPLRRRSHVSRRGQRERVGSGNAWAAGTRTPSLSCPGPARTWSPRFNRDGCHQHSPG